MGGVWEQLYHRLVDTHCHINHYPEPEKLIAELAEKKIRVHCVTVRPGEYEPCCDLLKNHPDIIPCAGFFPLNAEEEKENFDYFLELVKKTRFIGEVGLDYTISDKKELSLQREIFTEIINTCSKLGNKVLSIHSRRSAEDVLKTVGDSFNGTAIMHWFSGHEDLVTKTPENIFYSVNTVMLSSRQGKKVLDKLRPSQILTETDGPYVELNNKSVKPPHMRNVVNSLSDHWDKSLEEVLDILEDNYKRALNNP